MTRNDLFYNPLFAADLHQIGFLGRTAVCKRRRIGKPSAIFFALPNIVIERQLAVARVAAIDTQSREAFHPFGLRRLLLRTFPLVVPEFRVFSGTAFIQFALADHTGRPAKVLATGIVTAVDAQATLQNFLCSESFFF